MPGAATCLRPGSRTNPPAASLHDPFSDCHAYQTRLKKAAGQQLPTARLAPVDDTLSYHTTHQSATISNHTSTLIRHSAHKHLLISSISLTISPISIHIRLSPSISLCGQRSHERSARSATALFTVPCSPTNPRRMSSIRRSSQASLVRNSRWCSCGCPTTHCRSATCAVPVDPDRCNWLLYDSLLPLPDSRTHLNAKKRSMCTVSVGSIPRDPVRSGRRLRHGEHRCTKALPVTLTLDPFA